MVDHQHTEINTTNKFLADNTAAVTLCGFQCSCGLFPRSDIGRIAFTVIAVDRFYHQRVAELVNSISQPCFRTNDRAVAQVFLRRLTGSWFLLYRRLVNGNIAGCVCTNGCANPFFEHHNQAEQGFVYSVVYKEYHHVAYLPQYSRLRPELVSSLSPAIAECRMQRS